MAPRLTPFQKEMASRGGLRHPRTGRMTHMEPDLFDAYHGSNREGMTTILPASDSGVAAIHGLSQTNRTYFVDNTHTKQRKSSEEGAWEWAHYAERRQGGRATVYRTMPRGSVSEDSNFPSGEGTFTTSSQQVRREISIPPPSMLSRATPTGHVERAESVQGTLSGQDWTPYKPVATLSPGQISANFTANYPTSAAAPAPTRAQKRGQLAGQQSLKL